jgi:uncharacterized protein YecT (DUF1311 family)
MKMLSLNAQQKLLLRGAQREWIRNRDRRCAWDGRGSLDRMIATDCQTKETIARIRWLERYR